MSAEGRGDEPEDWDAGMDDSPETGSEEWAAPPDDPFSPADAEARAREERRLERERRRREGGGRGARGARAVGGAVGGLGSIFSRRGRRRDADEGALAEPAGPEPGLDEPVGAAARAEPGFDEAFAGPSGEPRTDPGMRARRGPTHAQVQRRRLVAGGIGLVVLLVVVVAFAGLLGGGDEPPPAPPTKSVTIPEGLTREQIADVAKENGIRGDYLEASKSSEKIDLKDYGAQDAPSLEGFLFPSTYELAEKPKAKQLVNTQLATFEDQISKVNLKYAQERNLTTYDVVKIASMIEEEVAVPKERKQVAAVIYNRLSAGMPLGIDATIRYEDANFDKPLTEERLNTDSEYNTRLRTGLPPTPISNPGLASIEAAADPDRSGVLFYVIKPGSCNEHVFTDNEEDFNAAVQDYQDALKSEGGSPTDCPE